MKDTKIKTALKVGTIGLIGAITFGGCAKNDKTHNSPANNINYEEIIKEKDEQIADLQQKLDDMINDRNNENAADKAEDEAYESTILSLTEKIASLNVDLNNKSISLTDANKTINELNTEVTNLQKLLTASDLDNSTLKNSIFALNQEIANLNNLYNAEVLAKVELQKEYEELKDKYILAAEKVLKGDSIEKVRDEISILQTEISQRTTFSKNERIDTNQRLDNLIDRTSLMQEIAWISDEEYLTSVNLIEDLKELDCLNNIVFATNKLNEYEAIKATGVITEQQAGNTKQILEITQLADSKCAIAFNPKFTQVEIVSSTGYETAIDGVYNYYNKTDDDVTKSGLTNAIKQGLTFSLQDESTVVEYKPELDEYIVSLYSGPNQESEYEYSYELNGNTLVGYSYYCAEPNYEASTDVEITEANQSEFDTLYNNCRTIIESTKNAQSSGSSEK